jgi:hypothetical protein
VSRCLGVIPQEAAGWPSAGVREQSADSTLQQLYDDQEFEAYRELGYHCAQAAVADICYQRPGPAGTPSRPSPAAAGEIRPPTT